MFGEQFLDAEPLEGAEILAGGGASNERNHRIARSTFMRSDRSARSIREELTISPQIVLVVFHKPPLQHSDILLLK